MKLAYSPHKINKEEFFPLNSDVIVNNMEFKERITTGGIILRNDNGTSLGIRPRWGQVYAVGPEQSEVKVGEWVLVAHGRWTRGLDIEDEFGSQTIRKIDPNDIMCVSDYLPDDQTFSDAVHVEKQVA
jgi:co-chaperonin GroES (HSP10)